MLFHHLLGAAHALVVAQTGLAERLAVDERTGEILAAVQPDAKIERQLHRTIHKVGEDIEGLRYNTAISQMMILANALQKAPQVGRHTMLTFLQLLAPFAPHLAEELWARLGGASPVGHAPWPVFDPARLQVSEHKVVVQVNGKHRGELLVPADTTEAAALALATAHPKIAPFIAGKSIKRVVYVPKKILNVVVEVPTTGNL